ncbi:alternative ribosome rescue aminoacyl-tRNA hydrolase ArfB [Limnoglobus roseus]|uniref:Aminoacyl-tRNA hydrolase n=1 Tax=Limnoglobus roseus TaxID=2598579 RepID=A0A5C1A638_9BACT|nr:alternative ribosome rescue aminoacyl-tRNA hydrolase ArfB [Limnoglobus roseus]QEL13825.1 aminoacyl-tRNA hydrolase [Limnoglobus roseus]
MFEITPTIQIPHEEFEWSYARSGGPGGQNVNKVSSKAVLRWPMAASEHLTPVVKDRVRELFPSRVTTEGELVISSQEYRDQERNREACLEKLADLIRQAAKRPTIRRATKPSKGSKMRRLEEKKRQSSRKTNRRVGGDD